MIALEALTSEFPLVRGTSSRSRRSRLHRLAPSSVSSGGGAAGDVSQLSPELASGSEPARLINSPSKGFAWATPSLALPHEPSAFGL